MRLLNGLLVAKKTEWPGSIPKPRPRIASSKWKGLAYEKALAKALPGAVHGQWFEFIDSSGKARCQVDVLVEGEALVLVIEAKLSWVPEAQAKLNGLYLPVVTKALAKPVIGLVVAKNISRQTLAAGWISRDLREAVAMLKDGSSPVTLHWSGSGPLLHSTSPAHSIAA